MKPKFEIIAEIGVNHNGCLNTAFDLVAKSKWAGADIVKFQSFNPHLLSRIDTKKASYQIKNTGQKNSQFEMLQDLCLTKKQHLEIKALCDDLGIEFLSTAFDKNNLDFLVDIIGIKRIKIPSGEVTNLPLLAEYGRKGLQMILSTGMATINEVDNALSVLHYFFDFPKKRITSRLAKDLIIDGYRSNAAHKITTILQCSTEYPTQAKDINLASMQTLSQTFKTKVGLSDHSQGIGAAICASFFGASMIEKHITLDKSMPGPDHKSSLDPSEFKTMVIESRRAKFFKGSSQKSPSKKELQNADVIRRKIFFARDVKKGKTVSPNDLILLRGSLGMPAAKYWEVLNSIAKRDFKKNEPFEI